MCKDYLCLAVVINSMWINIHSYYLLSLNDSTTDEPAPRILILREGDDLTGESGTERSNSVYNNDRLTPAIPVRQPITPGAGAGTAKAKAAKSPYTSPPVECVPVETISIPNDGNISVFTSIQLANFLRCLKIDEKIISHLHRKAVDGNRFGKMTDTELDTLGMNNPVIVFFRNKSSPKSKKKGHLML
uniref:SAM domain-containing protein n=1 Tax=Arion vulgaris TaxID=1028688 RepID=A0A0B6ZP48_9EUPU